MSKKKHSFTLFEILIALSLIALFSTFISFPIVNAIQEQRMKHQVETLVNKMRLLRMLSTSYDTTVDFFIEKKEKNFVYYFTCDEPLRKVDHKEKILSTIKILKFNQESSDSVSLQFSPTGYFSPQGIISFTSDNKTICLDLQTDINTVVLDSIPLERNLKGISTKPSK